jgi:hypothetical protein
MRGILSGVADNVERHQQPGANHDNIEAGGHQKQEPEYSTD